MVTTGQLNIRFPPSNQTVRPQLTQKPEAMVTGQRKQEWPDASISQSVLHGEPLFSSGHATGESGLTWKQCIRVQGNAASPQSGINRVRPLHPTFISHFQRIWFNWKLSSSDDFKAHAILPTTKQHGPK